jgi:hypothetical protein
VLKKLLIVMEINLDVKEDTLIKYSISVKRKVLFNKIAWSITVKNPNAKSNISKLTNAESKILFGKSTITVLPFKKRISREN